jgi:magnesium transporter
MLRVVVDGEAAASASSPGSTENAGSTGGSSGLEFRADPAGAGGRATWIDVVLPTVEELTGLAKRFKLHRTAVQDCLEPEHMPKFERFGSTAFVIFRAADETALGLGATPQELTRKIAVFLGPGFLLSIHRLDLPTIAQLRHEVEAQCDAHTVASAATQGSPPPPTPSALGMAALVYQLVRRILDTYDAPVAHLARQLDEIELATFKDGVLKDVFHSGYQLRRRASVFRHLLAQTRDILDDLEAAAPAVETIDMKTAGPLIQDLKDKCARLHYHADAVIDNLDSVLNLHLSLTSSKLSEASHKQNEVMRLLTVFSAFFLPLNFIAGIYGMNFEDMPELKWAHGYHVTLAGMAVVAGLIVLWFKRNGWLKGD